MMQRNRLLCLGLAFYASLSFALAQDVQRSALEICQHSSYDYAQAAQLWANETVGRLGTAASYYKAEMNKADKDRSGVKSFGVFYYDERSLQRMKSVAEETLAYIETLPIEERNILWLLFLERELIGNNGIISFINSDDFYFADHVSEALHNSGMDEKAQIFDRIVKIIRNPPAVRETTTDDVFASLSPRQPKEDDYLPEQFGTAKDLLQAISDVIANTPELNDFKLRTSKELKAFCGD